MFLKPVGNHATDPFEKQDAKHWTTETFLPSLDKPMEKIPSPEGDSAYLSLTEAVDKLNELIDRQNALEEVVKRLILKG